MLIRITRINFEQLRIDGLDTEDHEVSFRFKPTTYVRRLHSKTPRRTLAEIGWARFPMALNQDVFVTWKPEAEAKVAIEFTLF